jgi:PAS domain S-box-containing protein
MRLTESTGVFDALGFGFFVVDEGWNVLLFNREAERITGFTRKEALGCKCSEIFHTEFCNARCPLHQALVTGDRVSRRQVHFLTRDNRRVALEISAAPFKDSGERTMGVLCFREVLADQAGTDTAADDPLRRLVFRHPLMLQLLDILRMVAPTDASVLLTGETGTGKGLLAKALHDLSRRRVGPFVGVNCAALPDKLLESELFGYKKGAFTDARADKPGMFELAQGGTIFLDEIGDLPSDLQAKLLQALEERRFYPLGATKPVSVNVRVVAASNLDLARRTTEGLFRSDLYYRLRVVELHIPPLRERSADIVPLAELFLARAAERYAKRATHLDDAAKRLLSAYSFPGNVRELKHLMEHAVILSDGTMLTPAHFPPQMAVHSAPTAPVSQVGYPACPGQAAQRLPEVERNQGGSLLERERDLLLQALSENDWSILQTAAQLGINRTTLWRRMRKYGI